ncbi:Npun_F0494 family protein [Synechococcus sp. CS-1328]|uniref:Npun_F0494 family protein n=1 Tax=Synechococcus sp. CS-1328 TaxID=2847976 RepID=UPI00223BA36D|nr:Npun_F0494 family protein [Synechococcus sp. CS-1328]
MEILDSRAWKRAERAVCCLPYRRDFYLMVSGQAISSTSFCGRNDLHPLFRGGSPVPDSVERDWIWLIRLGVLRREVDGQGLTERVRLTPMGRQILAHWPTDFPRPTPLLRLQHWLSRHRPRR